MDADEALKLACEKDPSLTAADLRQEEDGLDTWFSSWLWPITLFNGILDPDNEEMRYYYPTTDLVTDTRHHILLGGCMIMAGYGFAGKEPFRNVYFTGIVRDEIGRKMSKQPRQLPRRPQADSRLRRRRSTRGNHALRACRKRYSIRHQTLRNRTQLLQQDVERLPSGQRLGRSALRPRSPKLHVSPYHG